MLLGELLDCPECLAPAEILDRADLDSTAGPVPHVRIRCLNRHYFYLPEGLLG